VGPGFEGHFSKKKASKNFSRKCCRRDHLIKKFSGHTKKIWWIYHVFSGYTKKFSGYDIFPGKEKIFPEIT
jgi:hypothetical protein